jgi:hypothetical protein
MHGLIFETSIWPLAGSTRYLSSNIADSTTGCCDIFQHPTKTCVLILSFDRKSNSSLNQLANVLMPCHEIRMLQFRLKGGTARLLLLRWEVSKAISTYSIAIALAALYLDVGQLAMSRTSQDPSQTVYMPHSRISQFSLDYCSRIGTLRLLHIIAQREFLSSEARLTRALTYIGRCGLTLACLRVYYTIITTCSKFAPRVHFVFTHSQPIRETHDF